MYSSFHQQIATEGIRGGHKIFSVLGLFGFKVEVEIKPVVGGGGGAPWLPAEPLYIKITVTYKDMKWVTVKERSYLASVGFEIVKATFVGYRLLRTKISAVFKEINNIVESITVKVRKK